MNEQNQQTANEAGTINDLSVATDQADEIKGGPVVLPWIAQSRGVLALPDLEPKGEIKGGAGNTYYVGTTNGGVWK